MNKRALMLTAATVALLSGQGSTTASAATCDSTSTATDCIIKTVVVTPIATSTVQTGGSDITLVSPGGITVTVAGAALKIDSDNGVTNTSTTISNKNTTGAIGVEINAGNATEATANTTVGFYNGILDTIDLTGSGTNKTGFLVDLPTLTPARTTGILDTGTNNLILGTINVVGDNSYGIHVASGVTVDGDLRLNAPVTVTSSTTTAGNSSGVIGAEIDGDINGDLDIFSGGVTSGSIVATGPGSRGLVIFGDITGSIFNSGAIEALGMSTQATATSGNPQGGTAFSLSGSVGDGIYNAGPIILNDGNAQGIIATQGTGPAFLIQPASGGSAINIGVYTSATSNPGYSFYNRGQINATPTNVNFGSLGMHIVGASGTPVTFAGLGIFNSGRISASASTDPSATAPIATTALWIDNYAIVPTLNNSNSAGSSAGNIIASLSGATSGQAVALLISTNGSLGTLLNSGTISATAQTSDTTITGLTATAIWDQSGTLNSITNTGTISAQVTQLDNDAQVNTALNLQANTSGVNFQNTGTVIGNIFFGNGNDVVNVSGTSSAGGSISGNISFLGGHDALTVGNNGLVQGAILNSGGGDVDITVGTGAGTGTGILAINNTDAGQGVTASHLTVMSDGLLGISLSQAFNKTADATADALIASTNDINLALGSQLNVSFGSFVSTPGGEAAKFVLFDAPTINILDPDNIKTSITSTIPFLFTGNICAYGISGFATAAGCTDTPSHDQLVLSLTPKSAATLGLTGYASQLFPLVNTALSSDNVLGSAVIAGVNSNADAQKVYSQFAPEVTGAARALAVGLTDSASGPLAARQRTLRMYAGQNAAATLWGQEFTQRFDNNTNTANGYRDSGFGFALGMDGGAPASGRYGAAFTFFSGDIIEKLPAQVKTSTSWYLLSGYSNWRGKGMFFDSQLTVGYGNLSGNRAITIDNSAGQQILSRAATNKRASILASGGISTGAILTMGTLVLTPQASLDLLSVRENGYTESGGGPGFDLKVDPYYAKSLRGYLGASAREDLNFGGFFLQPEARIGYRYDFLADAVNLKAMFAGDPSGSPIIAPGSQFTLIGPDPAKGNLVAGAGLAVTTGDWSLGINYDLLSGSGSSVQTGTLTLVGRI